MTIRPATAEDWPRMVEIFRAAALAAWDHILPRGLLEDLTPPDRWRAAIDDPSQKVLVASGYAVMAFAVLRPAVATDIGAGGGELDGFYSDPEQWGAGYGRALLAAAEREFASMGFAFAVLWTAELNHRPRRIYESAGWQPDGLRRERTLGGRVFAEIRYRRVFADSVH